MSNASRTGKTDTTAVFAQLQKIAKQQAPTPVAPVTETTKVEETKPAAPESVYGTQAKHSTTGPNAGRAVSTSAAISALVDRSILSKETPPLSSLRLKGEIKTKEAADVKMASLKTELTGLETRIGDRADRLNHKWRYLSLTKKTDALKDYLTKSPDLPPEVKEKVEAAIASSVKLQGDIDAAQGRIAKFKETDPAAKVKGSPERNAFAKELRDLRKLRSETMKDATVAVDDAGLMLERLMLTEKHIDPNPPSGTDSLAGLVNQHFEVSFQIETLKILFFSPTQAAIAAMSRENAEAAKRREIDDRWRQRDDQLKRILTDIQVKKKLQNHYVDAAANRDTAKMSTTDVAKLDDAKGV